MAQVQNRKRGRPEAPELQPTVNFEIRLHSVENGQGVTFPRHIVPALADVSGARTLFKIRAGTARCTPENLLAISIISEILGGLRPDLVVRGQIINSPPIDLVVRALRKLAATSPQARSFAIRRLQQLDSFHVESPATQEARS